MNQKITLVLAVLVLVSIIAGVAIYQLHQSQNVVQTTTNTSRIVTTTNTTNTTLPASTIVVLGDPRCHACALLKSFFDEYNYTYIFIDLRYNGVQEYMKLCDMFGLEYAIPLSVVINDKGEPSGVVLGAYIQPDMWNDLLKTHGKLIVYKGNNIEEVKDKTQIEQVKELVIKALIENRNK